MRGDILFFHETDLISRVIQWWTGGPYAHVAVDLGDGTCIGALTKGVSRMAMQAPSLTVSPPYSAPEQLERALSWLIDQENAAYSWADIGNDILPRFLPTWFPLSFRFKQAGHAYDCSDLVARFLDVAGALPLASLGGDAQTVTPNDLYRALYVRHWPGIPPL